MGFSSGPWVDGNRIDRFGTPFQPVSGAFITAMVKQLNGKPLIRGIFIDQFGTPFQPAAGAFITAMVRLLDGKQLIREIFSDNSLWYILQCDECPNSIKNHYINVISMA
jgi:hypothetical protein